MTCKMAGMVVFLVLGCIVTFGGAKDEYRSHKKLVPPQIRFSTPLRASSNYFSLGQSCDQPMDITSTNFASRSIPNVKEATFEGRVIVKQGDVNLSCDRLVIAYDEKKVAEAGKGKAKELAKHGESPGQIKSITASGNVKIVQNERMAVAKEALYDYAKGTIRLKGGLLRDGPDVLIGDPIFINLDEYSSDMPVKYGPIPHQNRK